MRNNTDSKYLYLSGILLAALILYLSRLTYSSLWFDETIEYFFSKFMTGSVPGSIVGRNTSNMYERICSTWQPPLYNVLMYVWLKFFDSEALFRLAGVLVTLLGASGLYLAVYNLSGLKWACAGTLIYLLVPRVAYYALEAAEYNLMLCCECWVLYFFIKCVTRKADNISLAGFFISSGLAVYSQYGAAFFALGLYIVLLCYSLSDKALVKKIIIMTVITGIAAVLPLVYFFLRPQMINQGIAATSHVPVFEKGNILYGIIKQIRWMLNTGVKLVDNLSVTGIVYNIMKFIPVICACLAVLITAFKRERVYRLILAVCAVSWVIYYVSVITSFYANTPYLKGFGNRYGLFFVPLWVLVMIYASSLLCRTLRCKKLCLAMIICFAFVGVCNIYAGWEKENVREAVNIWYDREGFREKILVNIAAESNFYFYMLHDERYNESYKDNIISTEYWINAKYEELRRNLEAIKIFELDKFYYIVSHNLRGLETLRQVMKDAGYDGEDILTGRSVLIHFTRK
ncbi:MAG: glycosyltransferase family 39 protein [Synergistaceae bacterium]|nr:glycosyltransferase family 39 protein [Synergistaceae bacterium]